jgi:hypothetical protein
MLLLLLLHLLHLLLLLLLPPLAAVASPVVSLRLRVRIGRAAVLGVRVAQLVIDAVVVGHVTERLCLYTT